MDYLIYPLCGIFAGLIAGLFGVGGGLVVVPVLASVFVLQGFAPDRIMHLALGTSLVTIVATASSSALAHHRRGSVRWALFRRLVPGIVIGAWLGGMLADRLPSADLRLAFGLAECALGLYMWWHHTPRVSVVTARPPGTALLLGAGTGIGGISSLAGIGGGTLTVPFLVRLGQPMASAVGTSAACGVPIALAGSASYLYWGWSVSNLPPLATGYLYWPAALSIMLFGALCAPLGAALSHRLPERALKRGFALLLMLMGVKMLLF